MPISDEKELLVRLRKGDADAFEILVRNYQNYVFRIALSLLHNEQDAEDVSQEVFLRIYTSIGSFGGKSSLATWIYRITYNMTVDYLKKHYKKKFSFVSLDDTENPEILSIASEEDTPEEKLEKKEVREEVRKALASLPEEQRILIELKDVHGFSYEDILAMTGLKDGTLKSRLNRGRTALMKILSDKGNF